MGETISWCINAIMENLKKSNVPNMHPWENLQCAETQTVSAAYEVLCVKLKQYVLRSYKTTISHYILKIEISGKTYTKPKY